MVFSLKVKNNFMLTDHAESTEKTQKFIRAISVRSVRNMVFSTESKVELYAHGSRGTHGENTGIHPCDLRAISAIREKLVLSIARPD